MDSLTEYETETGQIFMAYSFPSGEDGIIRREGFSYVSGFYTNTDHYILNGQPTERPAAPVTLSGLTLQGVPAGSTLTINGERYDNVEGDVELEFPLPGTYSLRVECWPYKDWEGEVVVPVVSGVES
jgi:hypothetical protein